MDFMAPALAAFFTILSTAFAYAAYAHAARANEAQTQCGRAVGKLNAMAGRVIALEGALETLQAQHRKLSGRFYQSRNSETPASPDVGPEPAGLRKPATLFRDQPAYCDNWQRARTEGPMSPAARCDCNYCAEQRFQRDQVKAELLPAARAATLATSRSRE